MNDIAKAGSSPVSTEVRTPAYGNFGINTAKFHHLLLFMGAGEKGFEGEVFEDLKNVRARIASIRRGIGDDVHAVIPLGDLPSAVDKQLPRSPRRNGLPVKLVDRALLMHHQYPACALV
jgi:hypothetical protein